MAHWLIKGQGLPSKQCGLESITPSLPSLGRVESGAIGLLWSQLTARESWVHSRDNQIPQAFRTFPNLHCSMPGCETLKDHYPLALLFLSAVSTPLKMVENLHLSENCLLTLISYF